MINLINNEIHKFLMSNKLQLNTASYPSYHAIQQSFRGKNYNNIKEMLNSILPR